MTETKRPPLSPLTVAALALGLAAVADEMRPAMTEHCNRRTRICDDGRRR
jgi:hypothetical protein